ncbi:MAG: hypothetical protein ACI4DU_11135 [Lachnospiraceae bacterium]
MQQRPTYSYGSEAKKLNSVPNRLQNPGVQSWAVAQAQRAGRSATVTAAQPQRAGRSTTATAAQPQRAGRSTTVTAAQPQRTGRSMTTMGQRDTRHDRRYIPDVEPKAVQREHISPQFLVFLTLFIFAMGFSITMYIRLSSDIIGYREQCANLQSQYESLKTSNDLYEQRINNSVDLNEIEKIAVCDLGMKLAGEGQIVVYSGEIEDYVKQYSDLPE